MTFSYSPYDPESPIIEYWIRVTGISTVESSGAVTRLLCARQRIDIVP